RVSPWRSASESISRCSLMTSACFPGFGAVTSTRSALAPSFCSQGWPAHSSQSGRLQTRKGGRDAGRLALILFGGVRRRRGLGLSQKCTESASTIEPQAGFIEIAFSRYPFVEARQKKAPVLAIKLRSAFVTDKRACTPCAHVLVEHPLPRLLEAQHLLK